MKAEPILMELEAVKERLSAEANGDTRRFLDQMDAWLVEHPLAGPVVNSPEELQTREAAEPLPPKSKPCRYHDPIIAEVHRARAALNQELQTGALVLKDEPTKKNPRVESGDEVLISGVRYSTTPGQGLVN